MTDMETSLICALAAIDAELGMPEDGCNSTEATITAIKLLHAVHEDDQRRIADLERNAASLVAESEAKIPAMQAAFEERLTLDRANRLLVKRISNLETKCDTLKRLHDAAADERDALRTQISACAPHLRERPDGTLESPSDMLALRKREVLGLLGLLGRLAEIEAQGPVARLCRYRSGEEFVQLEHSQWTDDPDIESALPLYARPVTAQAVPDADGARFRWLCEDHSDRETREQCRSLIYRLAGMSYSAAVMSIDAAMAAAPEHKA